MNTRIALTPPKRPPLGQCTGCNTKVGGEGRRLALCKDCGYQACGSCEPHYSRGTCLPLYPRGPGPFSRRPLGVIGPSLPSTGASGAAHWGWVASQTFGRTLACLQACWGPQGSDQVKRTFTAVLRGS